jgi:hypothetical protein
VAASAEEAVRNYLIALQHPERLRDDARIDELSQKLDASDDPLERLQLRTELAQAHAPDLDALERDFVEHAKQWAEQQRIPASAFRAEGVSPDVLRRAGLDRARGRRRAQPSRPRRPRVSREDVLNAVPRRRQFTITDVAASSGASNATARKVVSELVAEGQVEEVGVAEQHRGPGRAPTLYRRARP